MNEKGKEFLPLLEEHESLELVVRS